MTLKKVCLGLLAVSLVAIPAAAQRSHSNKGGAARADNRADAVQLANKKDKDRDPLPDNDTNKGKHKGETKGKHKAKGHSH
jgi:Ni/Co efflux regulator RcnB